MSTTLIYTFMVYSLLIYLVYKINAGNGNVKHNQHSPYKSLKLNENVKRKILM